MCMCLRFGEREKRHLRMYWSSSKIRKFISYFCPAPATLHYRCSSREKRRTKTQRKTERDSGRDLFRQKVCTIHVLYMLRLFQTTFIYVYIKAQANIRCVKSCMLEFWKCALHEGSMYNKNKHRLTNKWWWFLPFLFYSFLLKDEQRCRFVCACFVRVCIAALSARTLWWSNMDTQLSISLPLSCSLSYSTHKQHFVNICTVCTESVLGSYSRFFLLSSSLRLTASPSICTHFIVCTWWSGERLLCIATEV